MPQELVVLMGRVTHPDGIEEQTLEVCALDPFENSLVELGQVLRAELLVMIGVEVDVRQLAVSRQFLSVGELVPVSDVEIGARVQIDARAPSGNAAEDGPPHKSLHRPRVVTESRVGLDSARA